MIAAVETGGTKVLCAAFDPADPLAALRLERFPTTSPDETIGRIDAWFESTEDAGVGITEIGIGSFGPVNVDPRGSRYGWITGTSKPGWAETPLLQRLAAARRHPVTLLSDVTAAAVGEGTLGSGRDVGVTAYATIGTGVGVGVARSGRPQHGDGYPELGHLLVRRHPADPFAGMCPFHGDCLEGLASGPAVALRWGADGSSLDDAARAELVEIVGWYAAQLVAVVCDATGAQRVVLGGGVLRTPGLLAEVRSAYDRVTGGAGAGHAVPAPGRDLIVTPALGDLSGLIGAALAATRHSASAPATP